MATHAGQHPGRYQQHRGAVAGWTMTAAVLLVVGGAMAIFEGIAAIAKDDIFVSTANYTYQFSVSGWGWVHLFLGIAVVLAGFALMTGAMWARVVGVVVAGLSMISHFMFLPYAPVWSIVLIAVDAFIIWALCAPRAALGD
ncbi:DUF7144 family membrane protein [Streptomyces meridianus]|uniref:DUF7144 domain-containing protein n=1 Tax=Streptomyces meridianus TaxID=2938945 RepID=A0ABT0XBW2_9ACTN|nr:hypothetical protein [Streptomyces meridianus]MCM2580015.1 hypothetical protein [Streptomyces meridianus]